MHRCC